MKDFFKTDWSKLIVWINGAFLVIFAKKLISNIKYCLVNSLRFLAYMFGLIETLKPKDLSSHFEDGDYVKWSKDELKNLINDASSNIDYLPQYNFVSKILTKQIKHLEEMSRLLTDKDKLKSNQKQTQEITLAIESWEDAGQRLKILKLQAEERARKAQQNLEDQKNLSKEASLQNRKYILLAYGGAILLVTSIYFNEKTSADDLYHLRTPFWILLVGMTSLVIEIFLNAILSVYILLCLEIQNALNGIIKQNYRTIFWSIIFFILPGTTAGLAIGLLNIISLICFPVALASYLILSDGDSEQAQLINRTMQSVKDFLASYMIP